MTRIAPSIETMNISMDRNALMIKSSEEGKRCYEGVLDCFKPHGDVDLSEYGSIKSQLLFCSFASALPILKMEKSDTAQFTNKRVPYNNILYHVVKEKYSVSEYKFFLDPEKYYKLLGVEKDYIKECYDIALKVFLEFENSGEDGRESIQQATSIQMDNYLYSIPESLHDKFIQMNYERVFRQIATNAGQLYLLRHQIGSGDLSLQLLGLKNPLAASYRKKEKQIFHQKEHSGCCIVFCVFLLGVLYGIIRI